MVGVALARLSDVPLMTGIVAMLSLTAVTGVVEFNVRPLATATVGLAVLPFVVERDAVQRVGADEREQGGPIQRHIVGGVNLTLVRGERASCY